MGEKNGEIVSVLNLNVFYSFVNGIYPFAVAEGIAVKDENEDMITMMLSKAQEIALLHGCTQMQITESKNNALKNYTYLKFGFDNVHADAYIKSY